MNFLIGLGIVLIGIVIIFVIGVAIYLIRQRGGVTIPTAIMPSRKTLMNAAWMFGSYLICLWAFSLIWPAAWHAWYNSDGFWVTQFLFLSAIGFLASLWMRTKGLRKLSMIPAIMALILTVKPIIKTIDWPVSEKSAIQSKIKPPKPPFVDTTFTLRVGDTTQRYKLYDGWTFSTGATGLYQYQIDNDPWLTRGDGSNDVNLKGGASRLTPLDSSITVRVVYTENN